MATDPSRTPIRFGSLSAPVHSRTVRRSFLIAAAIAVVGLLLGASAARADSVADDLATGAVTMYLGDSVTLTYSIVATDGDGQIGCNASAESPATVTLAVPPQVSASPSVLVFDACGIGQSVTFTPNATGFFAITPSVSDDSCTNCYNVFPGTAFLTVQPRPNTPPGITITGVTDGATYEAGQVPIAGCDVVDLEDGNVSFFADVTGPGDGPFAYLGLGDFTATCSYTDLQGATAEASASYTVVDTTAPILVLPNGGVTAEATGPDGATVTYSVSAFDAADPAPDVACGPASGDLFPIGDTPVSCTATDAVGNAATGGFSVTVRDTTAPTFAGVPAPIVVEATGPDGAVVEFVPPTASDSVDGAVAVACDRASGSTFPLGETTVTCDAADAHGNAASATFTVEVVDTTPPELALPDVVVAEASQPDGTAVSFEASATDLVDGPVQVACAPASGAVFPVGSTTVACTATDAAGNSAVGEFVVEVTFVAASDEVPPAIKCTGPDGRWHANDVVVRCTATDAGSGLAPDGAASRDFQLRTAVPPGVETSNAATGSIEVCDLAGNCAVAGPFGGHKVDKKGPTGITLTPNIPHGTTYVVLRLWPGGPAIGYVPPQPTCTAVDGGAGLASCTILGYSSQPGTHVLTIKAVDAVGNVTIQRRTYRIVHLTWIGWGWVIVG